MVPGGHPHIRQNSRPVSRYISVIVYLKQEVNWNKTGTNLTTEGYATLDFFFKIIWGVHLQNPLSHKMHNLPLHWRERKKKLPKPQDYGKLLFSRDHLFHSKHFFETRSRFLGRLCRWTPAISLWSWLFPQSECVPVVAARRCWPQLQFRQRIHRTWLSQQLSQEGCLQGGTVSLLGRTGRWRCGWGRDNVIIMLGI